MLATVHACSTANGLSTLIQMEHSFAMKTNKKKKVKSNLAVDFVVGLFQCFFPLFELSIQHLSFVFQLHFHAV